MLIADLGRNAEAQRRTVLARERPLVHLITEQTLGMLRGRHVERLVVIIGAVDRDVARGGIGADLLEEIAEPGAAESPNHVPALHADVTRVLAMAGQGLHLRQRVFSGFLDRAADGESPVLEY